MPYIEREATIELFGETVEVPLWIQYERHDGLPAVKEAGGAPVEPHEPARTEIQNVKIITKPGRVYERGPFSSTTYELPDFEPADWLLQFMTAEQRGEIENAILEELE